MNIQHVSVIGAGAWGTALALIAARAGRQVTLFVRRPELATVIAAQRENTDYLPGIALPADIAVTGNLYSAL